MTARLALATFAALTLAASARAQEAPSRPRFDRVVIKGADVERMGWSRISELLWAAGWSLSSLDGFQFDASADGLPTQRLSGAGSPDWIVLLDGQPVPVRMAGVQMLELLPVTLAQVESVTVTRRPTLAAGRMATRGVIEVHTRRAVRPAARGTYSIGNERGDPGPYRYTPLASPNVERLGPDESAAAFAGSSRADAQVGVRYSSLNVTDEQLLTRIDSTVPMAGRDLYQQVSVVAGRAGVRALGGWHGLVAGRTRFTGLLYQPTREDWSRVTLSHAGIGGDAAAGALAVRYSATYTRAHADTLSPRPHAALEHERDALAAHLELALHRAGTEVAVGGATARRTLRQHGSEDSRNDASIFARATHARARVALDGTLAAVRGDATALQATAALRVATGVRGALTIAAGRGGHVAGEGDEWIERAVVYGETAQPAATPTLSWLDASWRTHLADSARMELGVGLTRADGWLVRWDDELLEGDANIAAMRVSATAPLGAWTAGSFAYRLQLPTAQDAPLESALRATPRHLARLQLSTVEWRHLRASAAVTLQSSTTWEGRADSLAAGRSVPAIARLDATIEKWFWQRRIRTFLAGRNLLDREERYHPAGAEFALRVMLGVDAVVGGR